MPRIQGDYLLCPACLIKINSVTNLAESVFLFEGLKGLACAPASGEITDAGALRNFTLGRLFKTVPLCIYIGR